MENNQATTGHATAVRPAAGRPPSIARALDIQGAAVKLHLGSIFRKPGAANRSQAARIAIESGWFGKQSG